MKVLLDENLPHRLRQCLPGHDVFTAAYLGWSGIKNGVLLRLAEEARFDVLLTADQNMNYQQNPLGRQIAVICLTAQRWEVLAQHLEAIADAIAAASPGSFVLIECGTRG